MLRRSSMNSLVYVVAALLGYGVMNTPFLLAQGGSLGNVVVTVQDQSGAIVSGADLELQASATNDIRKGQTLGAGSYSFVNLPGGKYRLSVSKAGYAKQVFDTVVVEASQNTGVNVTLHVGAVTETVEVSESATPILETTSNAVGSVVDLKQIEDLPLEGRDLTGLSLLVPGSVNDYGIGASTWNGAPQIAQGANIDGIAAGTSRMKFGGLTENVVPRLENIQEMAIQTDQLDLDQGFGQSNMQITYVTRSGTNKFHGRLFEDFRNRALNANSWSNDANGVKKPPLILNEFGASVGGPILKNKLFFFGNFSMSKQPGGYVQTVPILSGSAVAGNFQYTDSNGNPQTVNVLQLVQGNTTLNPAIASILSNISSSAVPAGAAVLASDPNILNLSWINPTPDTHYYPSFRVDYNISAKYHLALAYNQTKETDPTAYNAFLPGKPWANTLSGFKQNNYSTALTFDWTPTPTLQNEFRGGFLYNDLAFNYNYPLSQLPNGVLGFGLGTSGINQSAPTGQYYPLFSASDTVSWLHGAHTMKFGFSFFREQDHYYNPAIGYPVMSLGLSGDDPAASAFAQSAFPNANGTQINEAEALYATLAGHISNVSGLFAENSAHNSYITTSISDYNLDELYHAWGLYFQDSYKLRSNLTLNYGLRWDFTGADHDITNAYHSILPDSIFGPSGVWNLFNPGSLNGNMNPQYSNGANAYHGWYKSPQPAVGIIWDPRKDGKTIIRSGFSVRTYTEPQQYFWNGASDSGSYFFQTFGLGAMSPTAYAKNGPHPGFFPAGGIVYGAPGWGLPQSGGNQPVTSAYSYSGCPGTPTQTAMADFTFASCVLGYLGYPTGIDPHIRQPYTQSWNFGIQRQITENSVLEVRYLGNRAVHQWLPQDINETNIFQGGQYGVLTNFTAAQANLAANNASTNPNYAGSFANHGLPGQQATPLFDAAFAGEGAGPDGALADYTFVPLALLIQQGQVGRVAQWLTTNYNGTASYFCNLVGSGFSPCVNNAGFQTGLNGVVPINFLQANPFSSGNPIYFTTDKGYSTYHGLQVDFRQKQWHGMQFDANYTWSHNLGTNGINDWLGYGNQFSVRNPHLGYGPEIDLRHVFHLNGTYDLPFGKGRTFANRGGVVDKVVGGWTVGTILSYQSGPAFRLYGGYNTFNDYADGGVVLNGVTASQLQSSIGVHHVPGQPRVDIVGPKYLTSLSGGAISSQLAQNTTPGTFGSFVYLHGPREFSDDLSITKMVPITESWRFSLQGEFLNLFNHPVFGIPDTGVQDAGFGTATGQINNPRVIEFRANIEF